LIFGGNNDIINLQKAFWDYILREDLYMFNQTAFGEKLRNHRKIKNLTQEEVAARIGISGQAVSKWEKGECLPDLYNLKLLARLYRISIDNLIADEKTEKVIEIIKIGEAVFEVLEKPKTILAGKILYAKDFGNDINKALESTDEAQRWLASEKAVDCVLPVTDIILSVNFWLGESERAMGFVRETLSETQPDGVGVYKMPASLYIRAYADKFTAQLISKKRCEIWELFAYIREYFMPSHGFKMNGNGAQEMEVFDTDDRTSGYAYMPVVRA
jgi:transcriptional regulator with XRE-family HTH domain